MSADSQTNSTAKSLQISTGRNLRITLQKRQIAPQLKYRIERTLRRLLLTSDKRLRGAGRHQKLLTFHLVISPIATQELENALKAGP